MGLSHNDVLVDEDNKCIIDVETRKISNMSKKNTLVQFDHNSERVGFIMDRYIDGHDMYIADTVMIHYMNKANFGTYIVTDIALTEDNEHITFTWLISSAATQLVGTLIIAVNFRCVNSDDVITYNWSTLPCSMFGIADGYDFSGTINQSQMSDLIAHFQAEIEALTANFESYEYVTAIDTINESLNTINYRPNITNPLIKLGTIFSNTGVWDRGDNIWQRSCLTYLGISVRITVTSGFELKLICYDSNKNVLGSRTWGISEINKSIITAVNANTVYIRFSFRRVGGNTEFTITESDLKIYLDAVDTMLAEKSEKIKMVENICEELNFKETQSFIGQYFISGINPGNLVASQFWYAYAVKVFPNTEYRITANTGTDIDVSIGNQSKMLCATYSREIDPAIDMSEYYVDGSTIITSAESNETFTVTVTTSANAAYMVISSDDVIHNLETLSTNNYRKRFLDTNGIVNLDSIKEFGSYSNGILIITESFSIGISKPLINVGSPIIFYERAYFTGTAPTIQYRFRNLYRSGTYVIGSSKSYELKEQRVPPFMTDLNLEVDIVIPTGTTLYIRDFGNYYDRFTNKRTETGIRLDAHLGFYGLCPNNTMIAFEMAEKCGYPSCIVVPKVTRDGVLVCIHDDTINNTARDASGNAPSSTINVSDKTYNELLQWDFGIYKHQIYKDTKIPLLSDFFDLCMKTGMKPMFSTHPALTINQWYTVRSMLVKRGLLSSFTVKSFDIEVLRTAFSIFGNTIEGYIYDVEGNDYPTYITQMNSIHSLTVIKGIEYPLSTINSNLCNATLDAGYIVSAWNIGRISSTRYEEVINMGVTRFTDDYNCSYGLNW